MATTVGDTDEFLRSHVDHVPRAGVFVTADDPAGAPVQPGQFGQAVAGEDFMDRGGVHAQQVSDSLRSPAPVHARGDDPPLRPLRVSFPETTPAGWNGLPCRPRRPRGSGRPQRAAVGTETWKRSAARRSGQPSSTTHLASWSLPRSARKALGWDTKTSVCGTGL